MAWLILIVAGLLETGWAICLKHTDGFTRLVPTVVTVVLVLVSLYLLGLALRTIPIGTGYAVWTGIGTAGTVIVGVLAFSEPVSLPRLICVAMILAGIVGLKLFDAS